MNGHHCCASHAGGLFAGRSKNFCARSRLPGVGLPRASGDRRAARGSCVGVCLDPCGSGRCRGVVVLRHVLRNGGRNEWHVLRNQCRNDRNRWNVLRNERNENGTKAGTFRQGRHIGWSQGVPLLRLSPPGRGVCSVSPGVLVVPRGVGSRGVGSRGVGSRAGVWLASASTRPGVGSRAGVWLACWLAGVGSRAGSRLHFEWHSRFSRASGTAVSGKCCCASRGGNRSGCSGKPFRHSGRCFRSYGNPFRQGATGNRRWFLLATVRNVRAVSTER